MITLDKQTLGPLNIGSSVHHFLTMSFHRDQVAFITGGGSGIGLCITEVLMRYCTCSVQRIPPCSLRLYGCVIPACTQTSSPATKCLPRPQTISAAVDETLKELGRLDETSCALTLSFNGFKTVLEIDIMGMFNSSKVVYEKWFKDHGGAIVNISATRGYRDLQVHAGSAKAANDAMTKQLAVEWGPSGVRVNTLATGPILGTEGFRRLGGNRAESMDAFSSIPPQRAGNKMELDGGSWLTSANDVSMLLGIASTQSAKLLTWPLPPSQVCRTEEEVEM
uniref:Peroxisomal 2,4-dienoyl-CoA reductase [(3E)-enoyl-CoA-producing] n=1 Tax=Salmo trutta TaxID=8032 RepID=A0A673XP82_SALTR